MILTSKQEKGLKLAIERYKNGFPYTTIAGYAGTGKSTLVSVIISSLGLYPEEVAYISFTGKAALVLSNKGCPNATTAHKLLYKSVLMPDGQYRHVPKEELDQDYKLIVVDEVSMLPQEIWDLLLSHHVYIIALGDPGQLPPISGTNEILANPHIFLDEIMRQALDSEIISLTLDIREGKPLKPFKGKDVIIIPKSELNTGMMEWADQILCATNDERKNKNMIMRKLRGFESEEPQEGDKLFCLKNYWNFLALSKNSPPLVNGSIGVVKNLNTDYFQVPTNFIQLPDNPSNRIEFIEGDFVTEDGAIFTDLKIDKKMILTGEKCVQGPALYRMLKNKKTQDLIPMEFDYGYAITTHRAQGSQWDKVLVIEENFPFKAEEHKRWLYTACTRAAEKLVLVQK